MDKVSKLTIIVIQVSTILISDICIRAILCIQAIIVIYAPSIDTWCIQRFMQFYDEKYLFLSQNTST